MLQLSEISFGDIVRDTVTGIKGTVTAKYELMSDAQNAVRIEGVTSAGIAYDIWVTLDRAQIVT